MFILIFKTKDNRKIDGFPKVWIMTTKDLERAEKLIKDCEEGAWKLWKYYEGNKIKR